MFGAGPTALAATAVEVFDAARGSREALLLMADGGHLDLLADLPDRDDLIASGRLRLVRTADAYPDRDPARLAAAFSATLRGVLADGWTGMRVVADNTPLARGNDGAFADWLRWEHVTHRWQQHEPVVGVCWFDTDVVGPQRLTQLAQVHPQAFGADQVPTFQVLMADGAAAVVGDVDAHEVPRLVDLLAHTPHGDELLVDLDRVGYLHHTTFAALELSLADVARIRLLGASDVLRRVWEVVGGDVTRVELD